MTWHTKRLGDVAAVVTGTTPSKADASYYGGSIPFVTPAELEQESPITTAPVFLTEQGAAQARVVPANTVLVCCIGSLGKVGIAGRPLVTNQQINALVFDPSVVSPRYGFHFARTLKSALVHMAPATTVAIVNKSRFSDIAIPLPPLPEQHRIADILDKADAIRRKRKQAIALTEDLLRSAFLEMFGDPLTNPKKLEKRNLGALIDLKSGDFLPAKAMGSGGVFAVYGGNGINGRHTEYMFDDPTIVIGRVGIYCGAVHRTEPKSWVTDNALYVARMDAAVTATYLEFALRFADLNRYSSQSAQPLISGGRIYPVEILVPPLDRQRNFEAFVDAQLTIRRCASAMEQHAESLFATLSDHAFRGELDRSSRTGARHSEPRG